MTIFQAIIFGAVQGLGEFLPISSSGHLVIIPWLFNWNDPGLAFDVSLHFGTLLAVTLFFWRDWIDIITKAFGLLKNKKNISAFDYPKNTLWLLLIATIPGAIVGFLLEKQAETIFRAPFLIAITLSLMGALLYFLDKIGKKNKRFEELSPRNALFIGISQAIAIIPGVSRSGATISTALALGFNRTSAARFSFLISAPIIFGATILKFKELIYNFGLVEFVAILSATLFGLLAISGMLKFIEKTSYKIFFWYRLVLAGIIIIVLILK
ncbi:MAG: undecaprenyl-diphosphatase UppP [Candidatus Moraniibacteriota bacterium]